MGLYDPADGSRPDLRGDSRIEAGLHRLARVEVSRRAPLAEVRFFSGFSEPWADHNLPFESFRLLLREGVIACRNLREDAVFFLRGAVEPVGASLGIRVGSLRRARKLDDEEFTLAVRIPRDDLGGADYTDVTVTVDGLGSTSDGKPGTLRVDHVAMCPAAEVDPELLRAMPML
jgi:hypothetical protein